MITILEIQNHWTVSAKQSKEIENLGKIITKNTDIKNVRKRDFKN